VKLLVLGATGGVGSEIVRQAAGRAHEVTAFVRTPERLADWHDRIKVIQGDLLNCGALERVLEGQDLVLSGFGPRLPISKDDRNLLGNFARALTRAMVARRIQRAVVVSTAFLFKDAIIPPAHLVGRLFFSSVVSDAADMEDVIVSTRLDWTLVRPPRLTGEQRTGRYRSSEGHLPLFGFTISRADVADFMIESAEGHLASRKIIGVCN
jgi:putative NADH-flavin reductase